jgi:Tfp pilus assembly protein PilN
MKSIDFLPDIYRQRETLRRARWWWAGVAVLFAGAVVASAMAQGWLRHSLHEQLDALAPEFAAAQAQAQELSGLQAQIQRAGHEASLYTFLDSPWPRTQLLAALVAPLPEVIQFTQIRILDEEQARAATPAGPRPPTNSDKPAATATPAESDLAVLREEVERRQTAIELDGLAADVPRLHQYVAEIHNSPLIAAVQIKSLAATPAGEPGQTRFTLRLLVRPGYGAKGSDSPATTAATTNPAGRTSPGGIGG